MRKPRLIFGLLLFCVVLGTSVKQPLAPVFVDLSDISLNNKGERTYKGDLFSGEAVSYHDSGYLASADQFLNGRRHGYSKKWFPDGVLGFETHYQLGYRDGYSRTWWFDGNPRTQTFYKEGKKEGESWSWYQSGAPFKKSNYVAGQPSGLQQGWRENGKPFSNFEYKNGRAYGLQKANTCIGIEDEVISLDYYKNQES